MLHDHRVHKLGTGYDIVLLSLLSCTSERARTPQWPAWEEVPWRIVEFKRPPSLLASAFMGCTFTPASSHGGCARDVHPQPIPRPRLLMEPAWRLAFPHHWRAWPGPGRSVLFLPDGTPPGRGWAGLDVVYGKRSPIIFARQSAAAPARPAASEQSVPTEARAALAAAGPTPWLPGVGGGRHV